MKKIFYTLKNLEFVLLTVLLMTLSSCVKQEDLPGGDVKTFEDLVVPDDFTWSGVFRYSLSVNITGLSGVASAVLNGQPVDLLDMDGNRLQRVVVEDGVADFSVILDKNTTLVMVSDPVSGTSTQVKATVSAANFPVSFTSSSYQSLADTDSDGVADLYDDFPSDASKSFVETFPASSEEAYSVSSGSVMTKADPSGSNYYYQIFEDLWPQIGDFDLNDLIIASKSPGLRVVIMSCPEPLTPKSGRWGHLPLYRVDWGWNFLRETGRNCITFLPVRFL